MPTEHAAAAPHSRERIEVSGDEATMAAPDSSPRTGDESASPPVAANSRLGRYLLLEKLGAGGMGMVFAAYDPELDRKLAIKILLADPTAPVSAAESERLLREARAMAQLNHPNVVTVHDVGTHEGRPFIAMEFVRGRTLRRWEKDKAANAEERLRAHLSAGRGLAAAHAAGIVHRDYKPDNVMVADDGRVLVLDFGLAHGGADARRLLAEATASNEEAHRSATGSHRSVKLTQTGSLMGTPAYMAPEQFSDADVDAKADQFSYCVALWESLAGSRPFRGTSVADLMRTVLHDDPSLEDGQSVPGGLQEVLERGLSRDPADRWPTLDELLDRVQRELSRPARVRRRVLGGALGTLAVLGVAFGAFSSARPGESIDHCADAGAGVAESFSIGRLDEIGRKIGEVEDLPAHQNGAEIWSRARPMLEAWAADWSEADERVCKAARINESMPEEQWIRARSCLDERRTDVEAVLKLYDRPDAALLERTIRIVHSLPSVEPCSRADYLMARIAPPENADEAEAFGRAKSSLATMRALELGGRYKQTGELEAEVSAIAEELQYPPLHAELGLRRGSILDYGGEYEAARPILEDAYFSAVESGYHIVSANTAAKLVHVMNDHLEQREAALLWSRHAIVAVRLGRLEPNVEANVLNNLANVELDLGHAEISLARHREALRLRESTFPPLHPDIGLSRYNIARALASLGRYDEASEEYGEALRIRREVQGPTHPFVADTLYTMAELQAKQERLAEARKLLEESLTIRRSAFGEQHPETARSLAALAYTRWRLDDPDGAEEELRTALATLVSKLGPEHRQVLEARDWLAEVNGTSTPAESAPDPAP
jgi:tetratricopeptide (TPR) repeat protein/predicted Ser/Thr protein kinase